jgi:sulfite exporter TauE/SafE
MLGFGPGTVPAMCALGYAGGWLPQRAGLTARLCGALLVACGVWTAIVPVAILSGSQAHQRHNADGRI